MNKTIRRKPNIIVNDKVGSSETTRGTLNCNDLHNLNFDLNFRDWLIGFTEGDGFFIVAKSGYLEFNSKFNK